MTFQGSVRHDGYSDTALPNSPKRRWGRRFDGAVSYPLIARGRVVVEAFSRRPKPGARLFGLRAADGRPIWSHALGDSHAGLAYDAGRVFVIESEGHLSAFAIATGRRLWEREMPNFSGYGSPPVAAKGLVYLAGGQFGQDVYALSAADGRIVWEAGTVGDSSPALSDDTVFVSGDCGTNAFDRLTGAPRWSNVECSGGGTSTPVFQADRVWVKDAGSEIEPNPGVVLDAATGTAVRRFSAGTVPAFRGNIGVFVHQRRLVAENASTGATVWRFTGDGLLSSAPLIVRGRAFVGSLKGRLYALRLASGHVVWKRGVGSALEGPKEDFTSSSSGLAAGEGRLVVPAGDTLVAFG